MTFITYYLIIHIVIVSCHNHCKLFYDLFVWVSVSSTGITMIFFLKNSLGKNFHLLHKYNYSEDFCH